jgi:hypothetical protein
MVGIVIWVDPCCFLFHILCRWNDAQVVNESAVASPLLNRTALNLHAPFHPIPAKTGEQNSLDEDLSLLHFFVCGAATVLPSASCLVFEFNVNSPVAHTRASARIHAHPQIPDQDIEYCPPLTQYIRT